MPTNYVAIVRPAKLLLPLNLSQTLLQALMNQAKHPLRHQLSRRQTLLRK
jgi:hypothetical protein